MQASTSKAKVVRKKQKITQKNKQVVTVVVTAPKRAAKKRSAPPPRESISSKKQEETSQLLQQMAMQRYLQQPQGDNYAIRNQMAEISSKLKQTPDPRLIFDQIRNLQTDAQRDMDHRNEELRRALEQSRNEFHGALTGTKDELLDEISKVRRSDAFRQPPPTFPERREGAGGDLLDFGPLRPLAPPGLVPPQEPRLNFESIGTSTEEELPEPKEMVSVGTDTEGLLASSLPQRELTDKEEEFRALIHAESIKKTTKQPTHSTKKGFRAELGLYALRNEFDSALLKAAIDERDVMIGGTMDTPGAWKRADILISKLIRLGLSRENILGVLEMYKSHYYNYFNAEAVEERKRSREKGKTGASTSDQ